jgi:iron(III) transport system ATP-binding protein
VSSVVLSSVSRKFGAYAAVNDVSLTIKAGEFLTLLGPSGCGKTTTLRMIAGLEQNTAGRINIGDVTVSDAEKGRFVAPERRRLGMVFQSYAIWPHMTVFDNVAYPLRIRRLKKPVVTSKVMDALSLVEMAAFADRPAPALSGGQQQRVAIARALVMEPDVLLLDEPLSNLDSKLRAQMGDEFRSLQRRLNMTTIYVTHDQTEAMALSDRVVVMDKGSILQVGAPREIYHRPANHRVAKFFGEPNMMSAVVESSFPSADGFETSVKGDGWSGTCRSSTLLAPGQATTIMIRPEHLRINRQANEEENTSLRWSGEVVESTFKGASSSVIVKTDTQPIHIETSGMVEASVGQRVTISARSEAAWAVGN